MDAIQDLWDKLYELMLSLSSKPGQRNYIPPNEFKAKARMWACNLRDNTYEEDVIPYVHILVYHISQYLEKYVHLHDVAVHQVERKNFDHREAYYHATHRAGGRHAKNVAYQLLQRENRILWANAHNLQRRKRKYQKRSNFWSKYSVTVVFLHE